MDRWEILEYVGEALVFIGVVGEVFAEWREPQRRRLAKGSSLVLIVGLAISLAALIRTNEYFNSTIANLTLESSRAGERAARAELEAAGLQVRAEELEEKILDQGPRDLLLYGKRGENFQNSIREFSGHKIQVRRCVFDDNETRDTAERLTAIFKSAGWIVSPNSPDWGESNCLLRTPNEPIPTGIWVGTPSPRPTSRTQERAKKLVGVLGQVPLATTLHFVGIETARADESRQSIVGEYGDADSIVLTVLGHPSEASARHTVSAAPFAINP